MHKTHNLLENLFLISQPKEIRKSFLAECSIFSKNLFSLLAIFVHPMTNPPQITRSINAV